MKYLLKISDHDGTCLESQPFAVEVGDQMLKASFSYRGTQGQPSLKRTAAT